LELKLGESDSSVDLDQNEKFDLDVEQEKQQDLLPKKVKTGDRNRKNFKSQHNKVTGQSLENYQLVAELDKNIDIAFLHADFLVYQTSDGEKHPLSENKMLSPDEMF
jgi:hypothetical protein